MLALINTTYVWEGKSECLHSLILCVCVCGKAQMYSMHQLKLNVRLRRGQALIITLCVGWGN